MDVSLEIVNFEEELARIEKEVKEQGEKGVEELVDVAVVALRTVTPVDTGRARRGWHKLKFLGALAIVNPVEYIPVLNRGHSRQAPRFFIEQTLLKVGLLKAGL